MPEDIPAPAYDVLTRHTIPPKTKGAIFKFERFTTITTHTPDELRGMFKNIREEMANEALQKNDYHHRAAAMFRLALSTDEPMEDIAHATAAEYLRAIVWMCITKESAHDDEHVIGTFEKDEHGGVTNFVRVPEGGY